MSGFSLGYRKDDVGADDSGHMVSGMLFRDIDLKVLALKVGGGAEWGIPSMNFDQTAFDYAADGTVRYRHTYPGRNSRVPVGRRSPTARLYPFVGAERRAAGPVPCCSSSACASTVIRFHFDDYEVRPGDQVTRVFDERQRDGALPLRERRTAVVLTSLPAL